MVNIPGAKVVRILFTLVLAAALLSVSAAGSTGGVIEETCVWDFASVLSDDTKEQIVAYNMILEADCGGAQLIVATADALYEDIDAAADRMLAGLGAGGSNGMLLLIAPDEHRAALAVGESLRDGFPPSASDETLARYLLPVLESGKTDAGVQAAAAALYIWYLDRYGVSDAGGVGQSSGLAEAAGIPESADARADPQQQRAASRMRTVVMIFVLLALWFAISGIRYWQMRRRGYRGSFWPLFLYGRIVYSEWKSTSGRDG